MLLPGETDDEDDAPPVPGMLRTTPDQAAAAEKAALDRAAAAANVETGVTEQRLKELKDKARAEIDQRIKERRKKRRLMRGGDSGSFPVQ